MGYGKGYRYAHDFEDHVVEQQHLPDALAGRHFYTPGEIGRERELIDALETRRRQNTSMP